MEGSRNARVAADIVGTDAKIGHLEPLNVVDVQTLIQHTMFDDAVALLGCHRAGLYARSVQEVL
jgi:uncharacterized ParB-like nuclease family protein